MGYPSTSARLLQWRCGWEINNPGAVVEVGREQNMPTLPPATRHFLRFSCFRTAVEIALYNAVLLCYLGLLHTEMAPVQARALVQHLSISLNRGADAWSNGALVHPAHCPISLQAAATEIVRSFEYQLAHVQHSPDTPALFWLFPLGLASKVLEDDLAMNRWIQAMLDTSAVTRGYGRGKNAFGFGFYQLPKVDERAGGYHGQVHIS